MHFIGLDDQNLDEEFVKRPRFHAIAFDPTCGLQKLAEAFYFGFRGRWKPHQSEDPARAGSGLGGKDDEVLLE